MQITTGKIVGGNIVVDGFPLVEGATVTVLTAEPDESFALSPQDEEELIAAMQEIDRGESVTAEKLLERLRRFG